MDGFEILSFLRRSGEAAVLATVVGVEGHAYRKPGAMMLFAADGSTVGSVSPGCLEADLRERVPELLRSGRSELVVYNMRPEEDAMWGETVGCGGVVRILLEPVEGELREALAKAGELTDAGYTVRLNRYKSSWGFRYEAEICREAEGEDAQSREASRKASPYHSVRFEPRPRLVLFGAGPDAEPIVRLAERIGFRIAVADWRPSLVTAERFPRAELAVGSAADIVCKLAIGRSDYAIVCGHQIRRDREMLERLLAIGPAYVGVMGSASRIRHLFEGLPVPPYVHAPVGLDIGSEGAEEIAVSVAAELIAVRRRRRRADAGALRAGGREAAELASMDDEETKVVSSPLACDL